MLPMVEERSFWLAWSTIYGVGPILLKRLHRHFGSLAQAWQAHPSELLAVEGFGLQNADTVVAQRQKLDPEQIWQHHTKANPQFWTPADADYPRLLLELPDPPPVLYYRGSVEPQENRGQRPAVAIVGTRSPSEYGRRWTRRISETLAKHGYTIVSGLAEGIDTEAHRSCLAVGGRTLAVVATGLDVVYPPSNRTLHQHIQSHGLILSEYPAGTTPDRAYFPRRNRIIAGLSRVTLVLEAPQRSGALITAHLANEYGRDVYALPGSLDNTRSLGCLKLISNGAHLILSEVDLLEQLGQLPLMDDLLEPLPAAAPTPIDLPHDLQQVFQQLTELTQQSGGEAVSMERLVQQMPLAASAVSSALLQLELLGLVTQLPGLRYQPC